MAERPLAETPLGLRGDVLRVNATATSQSIAAAKAHSPVKAWMLMLNDALEQELKFTAEGYGLPDTIETEISTDFSGTM